MSALLLADNPDSAAYAKAVVDAWPAGFQPPTVMGTLPPDDNPSWPGCFEAVVTATSRGHGDTHAQLLRRRFPEAIPHVIQDYWGDVVKPGTGGPRITYFVRDDLSFAMTTAKAPAVDVMVAGCARHAWMESVDAMSQRLRTRRLIDKPQPQARIVLWLGQAPPVAEAYWRNLLALTEALSGRPDVTLLYRPHPRESQAQVRRTAQHWDEAGLDVRVVPHGETWQWLAAADAVLACFSNAAVEAVHLNRACAEPLNRSIFVLLDEELQAYHEGVAGTVSPPLARQGLALLALRTEGLNAVLDEALDPVSTSRFWSGPLRALIPGRQAARTIANQLCRFSPAV